MGQISMWPVKYRLPQRLTNTLCSESFVGIHGITQGTNDNKSPNRFLRWYIHPLEAVEQEGKWRHGEKGVSNSRLRRVL